MSFLMTVHRNRAVSFVGDLYKFDGTTQLVLAAGDYVRFKVGRFNAATPILDLISGTASANGSTLTIDDRGVANSNPATYTVMITGPETTSWVPGLYDVEVLVVDSADSNRTKLCETGVLSLEHQLAGNVGV